MEEESIRYFFGQDHRAVVSTIDGTDLDSTVVVIATPGLGDDVKLVSQIGFNGGAVVVHTSGVVGSDSCSLPETQKMVSQI